MIDIIVLVSGIFCICAAALDWDFFFSNYRARFFVELFGRNGARIFYAALGAVIIIISLLWII